LTYIRAIGMISVFLATCSPTPRANLILAQEPATEEAAPSAECPAATPSVSPVECTTLPVRSASDLPNFALRCAHTCYVGLFAGYASIRPGGGHFGDAPSPKRTETGPLLVWPRSLPVKLHFPGAPPTWVELTIYRWIKASEPPSESYEKIKSVSIDPNAQWLPDVPSEEYLLLIEAGWATGDHRENSGYYFSVELK